MSHLLSGTRVISFSSGKGGVGKTSLVANLGSLWSGKGKRTLLIEGDWNLGKLGIAMGIRPKWTVSEVLEGKISLLEAIEAVGENLYLLASPSGLVGFEEPDESSRNQLFFEVEQLRDQFDLILLDHSSGLHSSVTTFAAAAHQHVIVTAPEPTSYTDAYAIMKVLSAKYSVREFWLMVTMSHNQPESGKIIEKFMDITRSQLDVRVKLLDIFPWEPRLSEAIRKQKPFIDLFPQDEFTRRLEETCNKLDDFPVIQSHGLRFFYGVAPSTAL